MKKIAIDARFYRKETAGLGRYTRALLHNLAALDTKNDYTVFITSADDDEYDIKAKNFKKQIIDIKHYSVAEQTKFLAILNKGDFDLVHFLNFNHPILYKKPFIITIHDLTILKYPIGSQKSRVKQYAFQKVLKSAANRSKYVITDSEETKDDVVKKLGATPDKTKVIYLGYDQIYHDQYTVSKIDEIKKKYSLGKPYILFVSQWRPHKGLPQLIEAFETLKHGNNKDLQLVITGKPNPDFPDVIRAIRSCRFAQDIITPGFVDEKDLPLLYKGSQVFVFPSFYEGFGLGPLEAMATGTPVISSNLSCMPEILGDAVIYFDPNKPSEIADKIREVITNPKLRETMIKKGLIQSKKYSWEKMAQQTLELYKNI